jgi:DNA-binding NarL/FixJ family response regulator
VAWIRRPDQCVVILTLDSKESWELLGPLCDAALTHPVIALIEEESAALGVRAIRTGARSILLRQVSAVTLRRTVEATIDGQAVMPSVIAVALASGSPTATVVPAPTPQQLSWLRQLAGGSTVAELAHQVGYSERAMFRLLQSLYRSLGVRTRIAAIIRAQEQGWIRAEVDRSVIVPARRRQTD